MVRRQAPGGARQHGRGHGQLPVGALGFAYLAELADDLGAGNFGLLDQFTAAAQCGFGTEAGGAGRGAHVAVAGGVGTLLGRQGYESHRSRSRLCAIEVRHQCDSVSSGKRFDRVNLVASYHYQLICHWMHKSTHFA